MIQIHLKTIEIEALYNIFLRAKNLFYNTNIFFKFEEIDKFIEFYEIVEAIYKDIESRKNNEFLSRSENGILHIETIIKDKNFETEEEKNYFEEELIKSIKEKYQIENIENISFLKTSLKEEFKEVLTKINEEVIEVYKPFLSKSIFNQIEITFSEYILIKKIIS